MIFIQKMVAIKKGRYIIKSFIMKKLSKVKKKTRQMA